MNSYPITQIQTADGYWHYGLYIRAEKLDTVFLNIHGTASNFYEEDFIEEMTERFVPEGISMLSTNNRGTGVYDPWDKKGTAVEIFEDCLIDIDAWMELVINEGYKNIVLSGHSLGTEKIVYYMAYGKYRDKVSALVLLAPADSPRWRDFDDTLKIPGTGETGRTRVQIQLKEAQRMIKEGRGDELMDRTAYAGLMPKTPKSFVNFLGDDTEILKTLPFHSGKLPMYSKIGVPIFVAIGDMHEYTGIPIKEAIALLVKENPRTEAHQLESCDHDFTGREDKLAELVMTFIKKHC